MSDVVIRAEGLGKKYLIGHQASNDGYVALRDVMARTAKGFVRSARDMLRGRQLVAGDEIEEFWALKDVDFEIKRGDVVGIIGRNGAGKSTLLKILSRITEPSTGRVEIKGRVASLLEVGTGFHPELSGRENIFLNGAILGMSHTEIKRKFDEIVAFADVEKFLDTPVKRYSSGMYVRLAFAVAAHLEPEILVVDEVLAVGDAEFQKKCLGKMGEVAVHGRTVLFVSHNVAAVRTLCKSAISLKQGEIAHSGSTAYVLSAYGVGVYSGTEFVRTNKGTKQLSITNSAVSYSEDLHTRGAELIVELSIYSSDDRKASIDIRVKDFFGSGIAFASIGAFDPTNLVCFREGTNEFRISIEATSLAQGNYVLSVDLAEPNVQYFDRLEDCLAISLNPLCKNGSIRTLDQRWGIGSLNLPAVKNNQARGITTV